MAHLGELELAWLSAAERADDDAVEHVRWCSSCRRALADYEWLEGEIGGALEAEAGAAPVVGSDWDELRRRLGRTEPRACKRRSLVAVGVAVMACVMLVAPSALGRRVQAQEIDAGGVSTAPAPIIAPSVDGNGTAGLSMRLSQGDHRTAKVSLPFVPPPTPPEREI